MGHKMDKKLISHEAHEINYLHYTYGASKDLILDAMARVGHSRKEVMKLLKEWGAIAPEVPVEEDKTDEPPIAEIS